MANKKKEILKKKAAAKTGAKPAGQKKAAPKKKAPVKWHCINCGYVFEGTDAPKECPACKHPQSFHEGISALGAFHAVNISLFAFAHKDFAICASGAD